MDEVPLLIWHDTGSRTFNFISGFPWRGELTQHSQFPSPVNPCITSSSQPNLSEFADWCEGLRGLPHYTHWSLRTHQFTILSERYKDTHQLGLSSHCSSQNLSFWVKHRNLPQPNTQVDSRLLHNFTHFLVTHTCSYCRRESLMGECYHEHQYMAHIFLQSLKPSYLVSSST